jgi:hypothetical protein
MRRLLPLLFAGCLPVVLLAQSPPKAVPAASVASAASPPSPRRFDPEALRLRSIQSRWILHEGDKPLKDLGLVEADARQALRLIRELGLNEYGLIGSPRPVMEYWLCSGKAPRGTNRQGMRVVPLETEHLTVAQQFDQWAIKDKVRALLAFHTEAEARQALALFQQHRFTQVGLIGMGSPIMTVFFGPTEGRVSIANGRRDLTPPRIAPSAQSAERSARNDPPRSPATGLESVMTAIPNPAMGKAAPSLADRHKPLWRTEQRLTPPAPVVQAEADADGRVAHDYRNIQLKHDGGEWSLVMGSQRLANFGPHVSDARLAQSALRYYRCTEHFRLGGAFAGRWVPVAPSSPAGVMFGLGAIHLNPEKLEVQEVSGQFTLAEAGQVKLVIGPKRQDAREVLDLMQRYQTDRVCRVGQGTEAMAFLVRSKPYAPKKEAADQTGVPARPVPGPATPGAPKPGPTLPGR